MGALARELLDDSECRAAWERFHALASDERARVVEEMKADVDRYVRSQPARALGAADALMRASEAVPRLRALALRGRAAARHINGRTHEALEDYREAVRLYDESGHGLDAARVLRSMVDVFLMVGRLDEALACAARARAVFLAHGEERLLAQLEVNVGNVHFRSDDYNRARVSYTCARDRFTLIGDDVGLAFAEYSLGNLETNAGRFDEAERAYVTARRNWAAAGMDVHVADADYALAWLASRRGRYAHALRGLEAAREAYAAGSKPAGAPLCDLDLAEIYLRLDARRDALEHARRAATRFGELGLDYERARAEALAGLALLRLGDPSRARAELERAELYFRRADNRTLAAALVIQRAAAQTSGGRAAQAVEELRAARSTLFERGHRLLADVGALALARALVAAGEPAEAHDLLTALVDPGRARSPLDALLLAETHCVLADALLATGRRDEAIDALRRAVAATEQSYSQVPGSDVRVAFFRERHAAFVDLACLLVDADPRGADEALALVEASRMRSASEPVGAALDGADPELARARERLDWLLGRRLDAELGALAGRERDATPPSDAELLAAERAVLAGTCFRTRDAGAQAAPFDADVRRAALRDDELLLSYVLGARGALVFAVERERVRAFPLDLDRAELGSLRDRLGLQLQKLRLGAGYVRRFEARLLASVHELLDVLGERLLAPLARELGERALVFVPWAELHELPLHALRLAGRALIERHEVSYAPSIRQLARCRVQRGPAGGTLLASGASDASAPAIAAEMEHLRALYRELLDEVAPAALPARLCAGGRQRALHIAAHGTFQPHHPLFSGVRLGETFLTAHDVRSLELDLDLATLSGCATGRKVHVGGEELFGLEQALLAAGVRSVVSTLWALADSDSADLMARFYSALAAGATARSALCNAQRELCTERPHPFHWAPFVLVGDPSTRFCAPGARE